MTEYSGPERRQAALTEDKVALMIQDDAFPGGDPHGHRLAHERQIANASWWEKTKSDAVSKVTAAGLWAVVVFLCVAAWEHIKQEARK